MKRIILLAVLLSMVALASGCVQQEAATTTTTSTISADNLDSTVNELVEDIVAEDETIDVGEIV